jgi:hypothetical protein
MGAGWSTRHSLGAETMHPVHRPKTPDCKCFCCAAEVLILGADWRQSCVSLMPVPLRQADLPLIRWPVEGDAGNGAAAEALAPPSVPGHPALLLSDRGGGDLCLTHKDLVPKHRSYDR